MAQDSEVGKKRVEELLHYGVRGMRWGVRRDKRPRAVTVSQKPGSKRLKARGGQDQPASSEAIATKALGQRARKSGFQSLTNQELQAYNQRLNLEANAKRLDYQNRPAAQRFVLSLLGKTGKATAEQVAQEEASKRVKKLMARGAVTAAAAAV